MKQSISKKSEGFTIIEVLIVLAIAGLIMLIVFLAVPTLRKNSRNTARQNDASLLLSAVSECLANNNGKQANCQAIGASYVQFDHANAREITTAPTYSNNAPTSKDRATWQFGYKCDGSSAIADATNPRGFVVQFVNEGATGNQARCLQG